MKKNKYVLLPLLALILWRCGKDSDPAPEGCTVVEQDIPSGDSAQLFVPNAFSPNGDGLNDRLGALTKDIASLSFIVYDSKNNIVFSTTQLQQYWQAPTPDELTIYHYSVQATTKAGNPVARCGTVYALSCVPMYVSRTNLIFADQYDPNMPGGYLKGTSLEMLPDCN